MSASPQQEQQSQGVAAELPVEQMPVEQAQGEQAMAEQQPAPTPPAPAPLPVTPLPVAPPPAAPPASVPPAVATSPRRSPDFGGPAYSRHIRLAAVLRSCTEQPDLIRDLLGLEMIAETLGLPALAVERMMSARASVRRRLARRVRERLGLTLEHLACAASLPEDSQDLAVAAQYFAVAIRLAGTRRVMSRAAFHALNERWGDNAVAFGLARQTLLDRHAEVLAEYQQEEAVSPTDLRLFVRSLAAHGHAGAPLVALRLGLPVALATAPVANIDLALETGLPDVAAAALAQVQQENAGSNGVAGYPSNDDEAAWRDDATREADTSAVAEIPAKPDSTEAA
jgi:hypothetical protein